MQYGVWQPCFCLLVPTLIGSLYNNSTNDNRSGGVRVLFFLSRLTYYLVVASLCTVTVAQSEHWVNLLYRLNNPPDSGERGPFKFDVIFSLQK